MWEVAIAIIIIGTIFYFSYMIKLLEEGQLPLKILFLFVTFGFVLIALNLCINFATWHSAPDSIINSLTIFYKVAMWIFIMVVAYIVIYLVIASLQKFGKIASGRKFNYVLKR